MDAGELLYVALYVSQQLGVMLGVGSVTVLLCAHLLALHRREGGSENTLVRAARAAQGIGLFLMIASGLGAVLFHFSQGALSTLLAPAFLFKWILIGLVGFLFLLDRRQHSVLLGLEGGSWYALFLVHMLAPIITWVGVGALYASWMVAFVLVWSVAVAVMRRASTSTVASPAPVTIKTPPPPPKPVVQAPPPAPKPIPPPPPPKQQPAPVAPMAALAYAAPAPKPAPVAPTPPAMPTQQSPLNPTKPPTPLQHTEPLIPKPAVMPTTAPAPVFIPGLHIMPRKPEEVGSHLKPAVAKP